MPLPAHDLDRLVDNIAAHNRAFLRHYPGESGARQPIHTVYGGAQLFTAETIAKLGTLALRHLDTYAPTPGKLAAALELPAEHAERLFSRVRDKLERQAVEDFRIDFEDGFGIRPDKEEDDAAEKAARALAEAHRAGTASPFVGIRIKSFTNELARRSLSTLRIFLDSLAQSGGLPEGFVVTLPKVTHPEQVAVLADALSSIEASLGWKRGAVRLEVMVELTQTLFSPDGVFWLRQLIDRADGRMFAAHFGTYDYTASCNITAAYQAMQHPACDFAKSLMQIAYAGTGIFLSDGATNIMPVGPHRAEPGDSLSAAHLAENEKVVHAAWRLHGSDVRHSLVQGFYQGWDLHPGQLPSRYAAVYAFFLAGLPAATQRLTNFITKAAQATLVGDVFDDAATGQGLLNFFLRGINCGALTEAEALATGVTVDELRSRSFLKILDNRKQGLKG